MNSERIIEIVSNVVAKYSKDEDFQFDPTYLDNRKKDKIIRNIHIGCDDFKYFYFYSKYFHDEDVDVDYDYLIDFVGLADRRDIIDVMYLAEKINDALKEEFEKED